MIFTDYKADKRIYNALLRSACNVNAEMISEEEFSVLMSWEELIGRNGSQ